MKIPTYMTMLCLAGGLLVATNTQAQTSKLVLREDNIEEVVNAMTTEEKVTLLVGGLPEGFKSEVKGVAGHTRPIDRLGIPYTVLADGPAGLRFNPTREGTDQTFYCTGSPTSPLLASSWDPELVESVTTAM